MTATSAVRDVGLKHGVHLGIAENGKRYALGGDHRTALRHYREALRLAGQRRAPEVFLRHYTQCILESLELSGAYGGVIAVCERADAQYEACGTSSTLLARDHAAFLERLGINRLKAGDREGAREALAAALETTEARHVPVAEALLGMLMRGMTLDARRVTELQRRHDYFVVREGNTDEARARPLPREW